MMMEELGRTWGRARCGTRVARVLWEGDACEECYQWLTSGIGGRRSPAERPDWWVHELEGAESLPPGDAAWLVAVAVGPGFDGWNGECGLCGGACENVFPIALQVMRS